MMTKAVDWVCYPCGIRHGRVRTHLFTMRKDTCDACGDKTDVTKARDFGLYRVPVHQKGYKNPS